MIYNLVKHLTDELPSIVFIANGFNPDSAADEVMVRESGGDPKHWYDRTDWTVQVISRSMNVDLAKRNVDAVYNLLKNKFGVLLPAVTVAGIAYPALQTYQISPMQTPGYLGADDRHFEMFVFNLIITTK